MDFLKFLLYLGMSFPFLAGAQYLTKNYRSRKYGAVLYVVGVVLALVGIFLFYEAVAHFYADYKTRPSA